MPIARSWTDPVVDVGSLLRFRFGTTRLGSVHKRRLLIAIPLGITLGAVLGPLAAPGAGLREGYAFDLLVLQSTVATAFLVLTIVSAISSGGGRELLPREQGVAFPVDPVTDHLGALLMAPLNIAWLVQAWLLLGMTSYAVGWRGVLPATVLVLLFLAAATAAGQVIGWGVEAVRRGRHGLLLHRGLALSSLGLGVWLVVTDRLVPVLDRSPAVHLAIASARAQDGELGYAVGLAALLAVSTVLLVAAGVLPARLALRRLPRDEARLESGSFAVRRRPRSDLGALVRVDLASVLRSVPLRRGLLTLGLLPGLAALAGAVRWDMLVLLPGLVASGVTLLFAVNAWCLDGRGALWRGSLPVDPDLVFLARAGVTGGLLLVTSAVTVLLGGLRAGTPSPAAVSALVCAWVVVAVQVTASSMRWSVARPYAVDLRSARATPAPPAIMLGYSARLAFGTTLIGMLFSGLALTSAWWLGPVLAVPMVAWSTWRLQRTRRAWADPVVRSRVTVTVAA